MQERLMELGYMDYDEPTEKYGSVTKEAVEVFQRRHGLTVDGYIGEETYDRTRCRTWQRLATRART